MVDQESIEKAINDLRKLKLDLNNRVNDIMIKIENSYTESLELIDSYIKKLISAEEVLKKSKSDSYYDFQNPFNPLSSYIEIPKFLENKLSKTFKFLVLKKSDGFFSLQNIKLPSCDHPFSYYKRTSCKDLHCFKCLKANIDLEDIEKILKIKLKRNENEKEMNKKEAETNIDCCRKGKLTKKDIFIMNKEID